MQRTGSIYSGPPLLTGFGLRDRLKARKLKGFPCPGKAAPGWTLQMLAPFPGASALNKGGFISETVRAVGVFAICYWASGGIGGHAFDAHQSHARIQLQK